MGHVRRIGALTGVAALVKAGEALGVAPGLVDRAFAYPNPACGTNAFVRFSASMPWISGTGETGHLSSYGTVSLWYSGTCRSVAAQVSVPNPIPDQKLFTDAELHKQGGDPDPFNYPERVCDPGSTGCKTGFYDDAGIRQQATAITFRNADGYQGATSYW
jgi:hypothetical protein